VSTTDTHRAIDAVCVSIRAPDRASGASYDVGLAEDCAGRARHRARKNGPKRVYRIKPGAWLMASAKHARSTIFARETSRTKDEELGRELSGSRKPPWRI